jgi:hypothetical protein
MEKIMSNEINDTLKAIHRTLALIHKELVINNLPEQSRHHQRYIYTLNDGIRMYGDWKDSQEEKMKRFSEGKTCTEAENNQNYINASKKRDEYESKIDLLQQEIDKIINDNELPSYDDIYDINLGDYR